MKTRLMKVGRSRGIRLPESIIAEAGLEDEVDILVKQGAVIITSQACARVGWAEAARRMREAEEDALLDDPTETAFDQKDSHWR